MKHIIVFGSFVVDLMSRGPHLPVPGETVKSSMFKLGPGGKGFNQGIAAKRAGADITMVTKIGRDTFADVALNMLKEENMSTEYVFVTDDVPTGTAIIMVDEKTSQNQIMVTLSACGTFNDVDIEKITPLIKKSGYLLIQLETNVDGIEKVINIAKENGVKTPEDALMAAEVLMSKGVENVVVTLGKMGVLAVTKDKHQLFENYDVKVLDTTGAGDAFNGGIVTALSEGKNIFDACFFANVVSNLAVTKIGTAVAMPSREEVDKFINENT